jgi:hypothetical protein
MVNQNHCDASKGNKWGEGCRRWRIGKEKGGAKREKGNNTGKNGGGGWWAHRKGGNNWVKKGLYKFL